MSASLPLAGLGIVITRPRKAAQSMAEELSAAGARPIVFPALEILDATDAQRLEAALATLPKSDVAIFVSANAVEKGLEAARRRGPWPARTRVAAVGELTAAALRQAGFPEVIVPATRFDSDALLERPELQSVGGSHILVFRGEGGRERLKEVLEARGARVTYAEVYRRARPDSDPAPLLAAWGRGEVDVVGALSAETLENFIEMIGPEGRARLSATTLVVPHEAIAAHPEAKRFGRVIVSVPGAAGLTAALAGLRGNA
jgi:uroporphyrinogen-III synthase